ncbi:unnamed protein product [Rotaria magnacalcarata]|uniref:Uncharacterized protein n=1 Tax=Rotaria magnacalcarata TaxID=392030 RepID=A0A816ZNH8_9BILA|nr:unnamed protein product [Rotaria magnacalcarata]CAF4168570.1 unnamed protein product [Rotaria magnacalcarata]
MTSLNSDRVSSVNGNAITPCTTLTTRTRFLSSKPRSVIAVVAFSIFTSLMMTIGILTVCFTSPKQANKPCQYTFKQTVRDSVAYSSQPNYVAISDFNSDTVLDIVVANTGTDNVCIFLGYGDGTFGSPTTYSTGSGSRPNSVATGYFNNDSWMDIVVANYGTNNVGLFFGYGNGTFASQIVFSVGSSRPLSVALGDLNNDNWLDIVVANYGTNNIHVIFGFGNGSFEIRKTYSTGYDSHPYSVTVSDFNNDNHLDIIVANYGTNYVGVIIGHDNEAFTVLTIYPTGFGSNPTSVTVGDFDHNGWPDIVVTNAGTNNVGIFLGYGNGTFANQKTYSTGNGSHPQQAVVGDFNNDGHLDIAVVNSDNSNVGVRFGYGNGTFSSQKIYSTGSESGPNSIAVGDFNNDNHLDIAVTNNDSNNIGVLIGYPAKPMAMQTVFSGDSQSGPVSVAVGDFNNDKQADIAIANFHSASVVVLLGYGNGNFRTQILLLVDPNSSPNSVGIGDFNNDNWTDIAVANEGTNDIGVFLGYGNGTFAPPMTYSSGLLWLPSIAFGDFNKDGYLDIVVTNYFDDTISVLLGYGNGSFPHRKTYLTGSNPISVTVSDFNNDSCLDIAVANSVANNVNVFLTYGNGTFAGRQTYSTGFQSHPNSITVGDFNNDERVDIAVTNPNTNNVGILFGHGDGTFLKITTYPIQNSSTPFSIAVGDFNNDNCLDVTIANRFRNNVGVFFGYCNGTFGEIVIYSTADGSGPTSVAVGQFNNDNWLDIAVANNGINTVGVLFGLDYTDFASQTTYTTGSASHPCSVAVGDFNNDTRLDIAVANYGNNNVGALLGYGNGMFATEMTYSTGSDSPPEYVTVGYLNKDNYLDIAVANYMNDSVSLLLGYGDGTFGSILRYSTGNESHPRSIAVGDFNHDNRSDIVVANEGDNSIGIFFGFDYTTFQSQKTYSTDIPSSSIPIAVGDFNNDNKKDIVIADLNTNSVAVLLGDNNGTFKSVSIYSMEDTSYPISIAVGYFNGDDKLDVAVALFISGNVGVLFGCGNGTLENFTLYDTGNDLGPGPTAVIVGDFNKDNLTDIAISNLGTDTVGIFLGYSNGTFADQKTYSTGQNSSPSSLTIGDFNNDSCVDIAVANSDTNNMGIFLGHCDGILSNQTTYSIGDNSYPRSIATGDFNNDNVLDVTVANSDSDNIGIFLGYGDGTFAIIRKYFTGSGSAPYSIAVGDFNNDNQADIVVANSGTNTVGVIFGYSEGRFSIPITYYSGDGSDPEAVIIADFNNDQRLDIGVANTHTNNVGIFLSYGSVPFLSQTVFPTGLDSRPSSVTVGDFNNDNQPDIAMTNSGNNNVGVFLGYGNGTFANLSTYFTGNDSRPLTIVIGDVNNDDRLDIIVVNSGTNTVGVLLGYGNGSLRMITTYSTGIASIPLSIAIADFNNDSWLDIAVANSGTSNIGVLLGYGNGTFAKLISYSLGYGFHPYSIAIGDFNKDNKEDVVVANYDTDNVEILLNVC